jgi:hypothetical protein
VPSLRNGTDVGRVEALSHPPARDNLSSKATENWQDQLRSLLGRTLIDRPSRWLSDQFCRRRSILRAGFGVHSRASRGSLRNSVVCRRRRVDYPPDPATQRKSADRARVGSRSVGLVSRRGRNTSRDHALWIADRESRRTYKCGTNTSAWARAPGRGPNCIRRPRGNRKRDRRQISWVSRITIGRPTSQTQRYWTNRLGSSEPLGPVLWRSTSILSPVRRQAAQLDRQRP